MKKIAIAAIAALTLAGAASAADNANFVGPRAQITAGFNDVTHAHDRNDINYSAEAGIDAPLGDNFTLGVAASADNVFQSTRQYGANARLGFAVSPRVLVFGKAGYVDYHDLENHDLSGLGVGGGVQFALTPHLYATAEYKYADLSHSVGTNGAFGGFGLRF